MRPARSGDVLHAERITDGIAAVDGDHWRTHVTSVFRNRRSFLVYDLGRVTPVGYLFLHADNNDRFTVGISDDGKKFAHLWTASTVPVPGMQPRQAGGLKGSGRYLRLTARGGDAAVSVSELMAFSEEPEVWPPLPIRIRGIDPNLQVRFWAVVFGLSLCVFVGAGDRRLARWVRLSVAILPAAVAVQLVMALTETWPVSDAEISFYRLVIALTAMVALLRGLLFRASTEPRAATAALAVLALWGMACFYNLGYPQFRNHKQGRPMFVHTFDTRVYFPVVKYFRELRFDGVYLASLAAFAEEKPGESLDTVSRVGLRDLETNQVVNAADVRDDIERIKERFSPERWEEFKQDMKWFWESMGRSDYLGSLRDHGGNATPVWILMVYPLFGFTAAGEIPLLLTGLLDPLLLLVAFVAIGRTFGVRSALLCAIVFGATDFPMLGSNWAGATLRFDWYVALALAFCALKTGRYALGGALLALAGLIRAFPALACVFVVVPALWWLGEHLARNRALPSRERLKTVLGPVLRTAAGGVACAATLFVLSVALFSFGESWGAWLDKMELHQSKPNVNHVGLRTIASYDPGLVSRRVIMDRHPEPWTRWQQTQLETFAARRPLYLAAIAFFTLLALLASRGVRMEQAAATGLLLIPVFFYPANYYLHYIFLLPLLLDDDPDHPWRWGWISLCLLLVCALQYATVGLWTDERFTFQTFILFAAYLAVLLPMAVRAGRTLIRGGAAVAGA